MMIDDLGPLLDGGTRVSIVLATVIVAVRVLNATLENSQTSWKVSAATLTESADWAKRETAELRARVDTLEADARGYAEDRARWLTERAALTNRNAQLEARVAHLESDVTALTAELETFRSS